MTNSFKSIGVHWYSRPATLKESSELFLEFLEKLRIHNPSLFSQWYKKGRSKKEAQKKIINLRYNDIKELFGKNKKDEEYPETVFLASIWNGVEKEGKMMSLSISLGGSQLKYYTNNCILDLPSEGEGYLFYREIENQKKMISLLKSFWNPEWIMIDGEKEYLA